MIRDGDLRKLEARLSVLDAERVTLIREIQKLRDELANETSESRKLLGRPAAKPDLITNAGKVRLFLELFRVREELFPKRWENTKTGKSGYAPVCANEWVRPLCEKPKVKCSACPNQKFESLNEAAVESHLRGNSVIGTYAIAADDSCRFLACDFDEGHCLNHLGSLEINLIC